MMPANRASPGLMRALKCYELTGWQYQEQRNCNWAELKGKNPNRLLKDEH